MNIENTVKEMREKQEKHRKEIRKCQKEIESKVKLIYPMNSIVLTHYDGYGIIVGYSGDRLKMQSIDGKSQNETNYSNIKKIYLESFNFKEPHEEIKENKKMFVVVNFSGYDQHYDIEAVCQSKDMAEKIENEIQEDNISEENNYQTHIHEMIMED